MSFAAFQMPSRSRRGSNDSDSDRQYIPIAVAAGTRGRRQSPSGVITGAFLGVPNEPSRRRAASTGGTAQPMNFHIHAPSEVSRSRSRNRHHHHHSYSSSSSDSSRSRSRLGRRHSKHYYEDEERRKKREKERWEEEYEIEKAKEKRKKDKIIEEARAAEKKKKDDDEAMRKKILEEEETKKLKEKAKKEAEDKAFEEKVKEKFRRAGYSDEYIEDILHKKREKNKSDREWAIDLSRPTFIKVNRKYLSPDTLDFYHLPWEWDRHNSDFIIIKKYVDQDFQEVLFAHTKTLKEKKVITSGYTKDVVVRLKPAGDKDQMYLVREKSRSPVRSRRNSWMFT